MRDNDLLEAVGGIDEKYIKNTENAKVRKPSRRYIKWIPAAACICLILAAGFVVPRLINQTATNNHDSNGQPDINAGEGVHIPAIELPDSSDAATADMIGFVVYQGRIYVQAEEYTGEKAQRIKALVGEHLGTARGNIDEWSSQSEYDKEFASTIGGEVYSVNGYDTSFRICIWGEFVDESNNHITWIQFLDCMNGITLTTGKDLFQDRLHITERIKSVQWQSHDDWDYAKGDFKNAEFDETAWSSFWNAVDGSSFKSDWDTDADNSGSGNSSIYDIKNQTHLILNMNDGTVLRIRLIEGGYVVYDALGGYYVKIPEDVFNTIYDACGGTH
ncbi:MAG: hypothetical protein IJM37_09890 [Lachnospiraceae bacterium]|nr:hypothetical protein [Lachnospiraceae bacterium]